MATQFNFTKDFLSRLAPLLLEMYEHSLALGALPQTLTEATVALLFKVKKGCKGDGGHMEM